jgi:hypothetical protein
MAPQAQSVFTPSRKPGLEQRPTGPRLASVEPPHDHLRPLEVAQCSLCGIARPLGLLVPDGGQACADIRWYCKDSKSCSERWIAALPSRQAYVPATPRPAFARTAEPPRDEAAAEQPEVAERPEVLAKAQPTG